MPLSEGMRPVIRKFLQDYIKVDDSELNFGAGGDVRLKDVQVKPDAFEAHNLPVRILMGRIDELELAIPWSNLANEPILVKIKNMLLLVRASRSSEVVSMKSESEEVPLKTAELMKGAKLKLLAQIEKLLDPQKAAAAEGTGITSSLLTKIINNIEVRIAGMHLRFQDTTSSPNSPFALGVVAQNLSICKNLAEEKPIPHEKIVKEVQVSNLRVYFDDQNMCRDLENPLRIFKPTTEEFQTTFTIIHQISFGAALSYTTRNPEAAGYQSPIASANIILDNLQIDLNKDVIRSIISLETSQPNPTGLDVNIELEHDSPKSRWEFAKLFSQEIKWEHIQTHPGCNAYAIAYYQVATNTFFKAGILETVKLYVDHARLLSPFESDVVPCSYELWVRSEVKKSEAELKLIHILLVRRMIETIIEKLERDMKPALTEPDMVTKAMLELSNDEKAHILSFFKTSCLIYPEKYAKYAFALEITSFVVNLHPFDKNDDQQEDTTLKMEMENLNFRFASRPFHQGIDLSASVESIFANGLDTARCPADKLITARPPRQALTFNFNMKPVRSNSFYRVEIRGHGFQIVYNQQHFKALRKWLDWIVGQDSRRMQPSSDLERTWLRGNEVRSKVLKREETEIEIVVDSVCFKGPSDVCNSKSALLMVVFDKLVAKSTPRVDSIEYDNVEFKIDNVQVLLEKHLQECKPLKVLVNSECLTTTLQRCNLKDSGAHFPIKIKTCLPKLDLNWTESDVVNLLQIFSSLQSSNEEASAGTEISTTYDAAVESNSTSRSTSENHVEGDSEQVEAEITFSLDSAQILMSCDDSSKNQQAKFALSQFEIELKKSGSGPEGKVKRTYVHAEVGGAKLLVFSPRDVNPPATSPFTILEAPACCEPTNKFITLDLTLITDRKNSTKVEERIPVAISPIMVKPHKESIAALMNMLERFTKAMPMSVKSLTNSDGLKPSTSNQGLIQNANQPKEVHQHKSLTDRLPKFEITVESITVKSEFLQVVFCTCSLDMAKNPSETIITLRMKNIIGEEINPSKNINKKILSTMGGADIEMHLKVVNTKLGNTHEIHVELQEVQNLKLIISPRVLQEVRAMIAMFLNPNVKTATSETGMNIVVENVAPVSRQPQFCIPLSDLQVSIIPTEQSKQALLFNIGKIEVKNCAKGRELEDKSLVATADAIKMEITNMHASRVLYDEDDEQTKSQVKLVGNVNCNIYMQQIACLDSGQGPQSQIEAVMMNKVHMALDVEDILLAFSLGNLIPPSTTTPGSDEKAAAMSNPLKQPIMNLKVASPKLILDVHQTGSIKLEDKRGVAQRDSSSSLARFVAGNVCFTHNYLDIEEHDYEVVVENLTILDTRPSSRKWMKIFQRKEEDPCTSVTDPMLKFKLVTTGTGSLLELNTTNDLLVVELQFFMDIYEILQNVWTNLYRVESVQLKNEGLSAHSTVARHDLLPSKPGPPSKMFDMRFKIMSTELLLVESIDNLDTKGLIFRVDIDFSQADSNGQSSYTGTCNNLNLYTCTIKPEMRIDLSAEVINEMIAKMVLRRSDSEGATIDITMKNIFARISPATLKLMANIANGLVFNNFPLADEEDKNYSDLWDQKEVSHMALWFLPSISPRESGQVPSTIEMAKCLHEDTNNEGKENFSLKTGLIALIIEGGSEKAKMPTFLVETRIDLQGRNWSRCMKLSGQLQVQAAHFNRKFQSWEQIIEPVEKQNNGVVFKKPWEVQYEIAVCPTNSISNSISAMAKATTTSIHVQSKDIAEVTLTKCAINDILTISEDFLSAAKEPFSRRKLRTAALTVVNHTGIDVLLLSEENGRFGTFACLEKGVQDQAYVLRSGSEVNLYLAEETGETSLPASVLTSQDQNLLIEVEVRNTKFKRTIPIQLCAKRLFALTTHAGNATHGLVCEVLMEDFTKVVTFRGDIQVMNDLLVPVKIYMVQGDEITTLVGTVYPNKSLDLPIGCADTKRCFLRFLPEGYLPTEGFDCDEVFRGRKIIKYLRSASRKPEHDYFNIQVIGEDTPVLQEGLSHNYIKNKSCLIRLKPLVVIRNFLTVPVGYYVDQHESRMKALEPGGMAHATNVILGTDDECAFRLKIYSYNGQSWNTDVVTTNKSSKMTELVFRPERNATCKLTLGICRETVNHEIQLHIYCPFWISNRTGLDLVYTSDGRNSLQVTHLGSKDSPVLFSINAKGFVTPHTAHVKVLYNPNGFTDWCEKFSLLADTNTIVTCRAPTQIYQIVTEIKSSSTGLTRHVTLSPKYVLQNQCPHTIFAVEANGAGDEIVVPAGECVPFWPKSATPHMKAVVKLLERRDETLPFRYDKIERTLLQLPNKYGGILVDILLIDSKTTIVFTKFVPGQAPWLLINGLKEMTVDFIQKDSQHAVSLMPGHAQLFTWTNPLGNRLLHWRLAGNPDSEMHHVQKNLEIDGYRKFHTDENPSGEDRPEYYCASFLDGNQRILLFTENSSLVEAVQTNAFEVNSAEYTISLDGFGLSLVDNETQKEVMYLRIAGSEVVWNCCKDPGRRKPYKPLSIADYFKVEDEFQKKLVREATSEIGESIIRLPSGLKVDLHTMLVMEPYSAKLRRVHEAGLWINCKSFSDLTQIVARFNRIQIDNQLPDGVFPVVLAPVESPKSMAEVDAKKPFVEISICKTTNPQSKVVKYKYIKLDVQELFLRLNRGFLNALVGIFSGESTAAEYSTDLFTKEYAEGSSSLNEYFIHQAVARGQAHFYDLLDVSPTKIHLSLSLTGSSYLSSNFPELILERLGLNLAEMHDVVLQLACFELRHTHLTSQQVQEKVLSHYRTQAIRQLPVLILGLDVIGNPFGLAMGVAKGVENFIFEPFQGAIQGEFIEGLTRGVKSLLGGTVGGLAGSLSKITWTLGKGFAAVTFDHHYRKKRRESFQNPGNALETFSRSGKDLFLGFHEGLSGLIMNPIEGAKEDGVGGFFQGLAKGAVGLLARPAVAVVDFSAGTFNALKKATTCTVDVGKTRLPRFVPPDRILGPYVCQEAEGIKLLNGLQKGKFANTENYVTHALSNLRGTFVVLLTNRRILLLRRNLIFGTWVMQWSHNWEDFETPPTVVNSGLKFTLKGKTPKKIPFLRKPKTKYLLAPIENSDVARGLKFKIDNLLPSCCWDAREPRSN